MREKNNNRYSVLLKPKVERCKTKEEIIYNNRNHEFQHTKHQIILMRTFIFFLSSLTPLALLFKYRVFFLCSSLGTQLYCVHVHGLFLLFRKKTVAIAWNSAHIAMKHNTFRETSYLLFFLRSHCHVRDFGNENFNWCIQCLPHTRITQPSIDIVYKFIVKSKKEIKKKYPEIQTTLYWLKNKNYSTIQVTFFKHFEWDFSNQAVWMVLIVL